MTDQERACLEKLVTSPLWVSSAWWTEGLTDTLRKLQERGMVDCRDRDQEPADPIDLDVGGRWLITDAAREALDELNRHQG